MLKSSMMSCSLFIILLMSEVFVRIASVKPSCGPRITFSFSGVEILRFSNPFASIRNAQSSVSIKSAETPALTFRAMLSNSLSVDTSFCGTRLSKM